MIPWLLLMGGKRGVEPGVMTTTSTLAGTAELAALALVTDLVKLCSISNKRELQVNVSPEIFLR